MKRSSLTVLLALAVVPASAQEKAAPSPPRFSAGVELVTVDVVVTDKAGRPITGLRPTDFVLSEDGTPQSAETFEAVELPALPSATPAPAPAVSTNIGAKTRSNRSFVILFDDMHMSPVQAQRAKTAVAEFLTKGTREGDRVSLVASGGGAWWSARMEAGRSQLLDLLKRLEGRYVRPISMNDQMSAWEAMRIHIYHDQQVADKVYRRFKSLGVITTESSQDDTDSKLPGDFDPWVSMRAIETYEEARRRNETTLDVMQRAALSLTQTKGRKSLILVSEGFIYDPYLEEFKRVLHAAREANVAIYFVDTRGLAGLPTIWNAEFGPPTDPNDIGSHFLDTMAEGEGAENLADESGGFTVKNTNDFSSGIQRIANESRAYYLLGYNPTNTARDGRWRKIQVRLKRKDVTVRARKGYFAPLEGAPDALTARRKTEDAVDYAFQEALDAPGDIETVSLRMADYVFGETILGKANTMVVTEVDLNGFVFEEKDGRYLDTIELLLVAAHRETGEYFRYDQKIEMKLQPATRKRLLATWYPIVREFELPPGGYQAKIVVRDHNSGRVGTVTHEFEVPSLGGWRVSSLLLTDTVQSSQAASAPKEQGTAPAGAVGPGSGVAPGAAPATATAPAGATTPTTAPTWIEPVVIAHRSFKPEGMIFGRFEVYGATKDKADFLPKVSAGWVVSTKDGTVVTQSPPTEIRPMPDGTLLRRFGFEVEGYKPGEYQIALTVRDNLEGKTMEVREPFVIEGETSPATAAVQPETRPVAAPPASPTAPSPATP